MPTNGIGAPLPPLPRPTTSRSPYGLDTGMPASRPDGVRPTFPSRVQPPVVESTVGTSLPPQEEMTSLRPPRGTDPELWKVLTADERAFFAREEAMGPLSYGHRIAAGPTIPARGGRLNLRG